MKRFLFDALLFSAMIAALLFTSFLQAAGPSAKARAALALAALSSVPAEQGDCGCGGILPCECGPNCTCGFKGTVTKSNYKSPPNPIENLTYQIAYQRAVRQNKPLLVWVGETCPACEQTWTQYVHCHCTEYDSLTGTYKGPGVMVTKPDGLGGMTIASTLNGIPTLQTVQGILGLNKSATADTTCVCPDGTVCNCPGGVCPAQCYTAPQAPPVYVQPAPQFFAPMPMMGGFGGGGCAGGSCGGG